MSLDHTSLTVKEKLEATLVTYRDLMNAIVRRFIVIVGVRTALEAARKVPGIKVSDEGIVTSQADYGELVGLIAEYKRIGGTLSIYFMKKEIAPLLAEAKSLSLPDDLR